MEEADKDWMMIGMVGGWVFLLVPAHQGSPGQRAVKRLLLLLSIYHTDATVHEIDWAKLPRIFNCIKTASESVALWILWTLGWKPYHSLLNGCVSIVNVAACGYRIWMVFLWQQKWKHTDIVSCYSLSQYNHMQIVQTLHVHLTTYAILLP